MKKLQMKYNLLHILYWMATCCIYGYVAVFLQYKGMSNTEIGIVSGSGCILTIFLSPFVTSLISKIKGLTIKQLLSIIYLIIAGAFLTLALVDLSVILIMLLYVSMMSLIVSTVPFLSMIAMNYIQDGKEINFGLARGMGSISYAVSAVLLGQFIEFFNPTILAYVFVISAILDLVILYSLPNTNVKQATHKKEGNIFTIIKNYKVFFFILLGFSFMFAAATSLSTYLINVVKNLGGNTSLYGVAIFFMAASEMPVMAITPRLIRRYDSITLIMVAAFFYIIRNFTICLAPSLPVLFIGMMMQSLSYGLLTAVITYYVTYNLKSHDQMMGQTMKGIMTSGVGSTIGNLFGGILQDQYGLNMMFIFACLITIIGVIIIFSTGYFQKKQLNTPTKQ